MLVAQRIPHWLNGVSQRAPYLRHFSEVQEQINAISDWAQGVRKRPAAVYGSKFSTDATLWDTAFIHPINRDAATRYHVTVRNGTVRVFDADSGSEYTVENPSPAYLAGADSTNVKAVTVGDTTILVNTNTVVGKGTAKTAALAHEALVFVRQADYSTRYEVTVDGKSVAITTAEGTMAEARGLISTDALATDLAAALLSNVYIVLLFNVTVYGSTIHIAKKSGADFTITSTDGLADNGLRVIKEKVQAFEDLPRRAVNGFMVKVVGDPSTDADDFWVKYDTTGTSGDEGVWREAPAPSMLTDIDPTTMPVRLTRSGTLLFTGAAHEGSLAEPVNTLGAETVAHPAFSKDENDVAIDGTVDYSMSDHNNAAYLLPAIAGGTKLITLRYDVDTSRLEPGVKLNVNLMHKTAGGTETVLDTHHYYRGTTRSNVEISQSLTVATGDFVGLKIWYSYGYFVGGLSTAGIVVAKRQLTAAERTAGLLDGCDIPTRGETLLTFAPTDYYAPGTRVRVVVDTVTCDYTVPAGPALSGTAVASGVKTAIDAILGTDYTITLNGSEVSVAWTTTTTHSAPPECVSSVTATTNTFYNSALALTTDALVGKVILNTTDGSYGTITTNSADSITCVLGGGADNTFDPGDAASVEGSGSYLVVEEIDWGTRSVGDDTTSPFPSFVGQQIREVFFYQGRLGFTSRENVVLSEAGSLFNFWRTTIRSLLDSDPIDVQAAFRDVTVFNHVILWNEGLYLFTDKGQYRLSGDPLLTPASVRIDFVSSYPANRTVAPVVMGRSLFFPHERQGFTSIVEMFIDDADRTDAQVVSKHVPTYLKGNPLDLVGDPALGLVFLRTDASATTIYVYAYHDEGGDRGLRSWSKWTFGTTTSIVGLDMLDGKLILLAKDSTGLFSHILDVAKVLDPSDGTPDEKYEHLDRRLAHNSAGVTVAWTGTQTEITLPYSDPTSVQAVDRATGTTYTLTLSTGKYILVGTDLSAMSLYIGVPFTFTLTLSPIYYRDQNGAAETRGRLQLRYIDIGYQDTTDLTISVTPDGRAARTTTVDLAGPASDIQRVSVQARAEDCTISLTDATPGSVVLTGADWEGFLSRRAQRA
jgi:hypothetical protein